MVGSETNPQDLPGGPFRPRDVAVPGGTAYRDVGGLPHGIWRQRQGCRLEARGGDAQDGICRAPSFPVPGRRGRILRCICAGGLPMARISALQARWAWPQRRPEMPLPGLQEDVRACDRHDIRLGASPRLGMGHVPAEDPRQRERGGMRPGPPALLRDPSMLDGGALRCPRRPPGRHRARRWDMAR